MGCEPWREAISARADGESPGVDEALLDAHLRGCPDCRGYADGIDRLNRAARLRAADAVPDLTEAILTGRGRRWRIDPTPVLRWLLVLIAAIETGMAAPQFLSRWHTGGELGTWEIAAAIGFLSVALRPTTAGAMLPMLACAAGLTTYISSRDIAGGATRLGWEWPHGLLLAGVAVLALLWRRERVGPPGRERSVTRDRVTGRTRARRAA